MLKAVLNVLIAIACIIGFLVIVIAWFLLSTPRPTNVKSCFTTEMYKVHLCRGQPNYVSLSHISAHMRNAVVASEDTTFFSHKGIDFFEMQKSFEKNMKEGKFARGGSTITQQLAKNLYLSSEKSLLRKLREALITVQLEEILSKEEILEKYLNVVEFGENVYGVKQASQVYFGKSPAQLTAVDSAFLTFLLPNPKKYSVSFRKKQLTPFARKQIKNILGKLYYFKKLSTEDYNASISQVDHMWSAAPAMENEEESYAAPVEAYTGDESYSGDKYDSEQTFKSDTPDGRETPASGSRFRNDDEAQDDLPTIVPPLPVDDDEAAMDAQRELQAPAAEEIQNELDNKNSPRYEESEEQQ
jgi:monofunctional glycosyltransferase